jgi:hypothetical protein
MCKNSIRITVLFENPFWVGFLERFTMEGYAVAKTTFGAEPSDNEVYHFLLNQSDKLLFSRPALENEKPDKQINPKRKQREAHKLLKNNRVISKAHEAIKQLRGEMQAIVKQKNRLKREELKKQQYQLKQEKRKQKHKGH